MAAERVAPASRHPWWPGPALSCASPQARRWPSCPGLRRAGLGRTAGAQTPPSSLGALAVPPWAGRLQSLGRILLLMAAETLGFVSRSAQGLGRLLPERDGQRVDSQCSGQFCHPWAERAGTRLGLHSHLLHAQLASGWLAARTYLPLSWGVRSSLPRACACVVCPCLRAHVCVHVCQRVSVCAALGCVCMSVMCCACLCVFTSVCVCVHVCACLCMSVLCVRFKLT